MKDPKITFDMVRNAYLLKGGKTTKRDTDSALCWQELAPCLRDLATMSRIARATQRLNERICNEGSSDELDAEGDRLEAKGNAIAAKYGARFHQYGEGSGLWPHVRVADGRTFAP